MKVVWTESATSQLQGIHDYIAETSPEYALRMIDRLTRRSIQIADFPFSGRMVPEYEQNELREVLDGLTGLSIRLIQHNRESKYWLLFMVRESGSELQTKSDGEMTYAQRQSERHHHGLRSARFW